MNCKRYAKPLFDTILDSCEAACYRGSPKRVDERLVSQACHSPAVKPRPKHMTHYFFILSSTNYFSSNLSEMYVVQCFFPKAFVAFNDGYESCILKQHFTISYFIQTESRNKLLSLLAQSSLQSIFFSLLYLHSCLPASFFPSFSLLFFFLSFC